MTPDDRYRRSPTDTTITTIWRRATLLAVALLAATVALVIALRITHTGTAKPKPATGTSTLPATDAPAKTATAGTASPASTRPVASTPGAMPPPPAPSVTELQLTLTDASRPTVSHGHELAALRTLPTTIYLPATDDGSPIGAHLPLVVFLHGFAVAPPTYDGLLRTWARAGFVVAAPTLPLTSSASGANTDEHDLVNEPADVSFLITTLMARSAQNGGPLAGRIDPDRVAVAGHSDGADVAFLVGFGTAQRDQRVKAVIDLSGDLLNWTGPLTSTTGSPPLLQIVSDADEYVSVPQAQELYDAVCCHKWWVLLHGPRHLAPFTSPANAWTPIVDAVTVAFLNRFAGGYAVPADRITAAADNPPLASLHASSP